MPQPIQELHVLPGVDDPLPLLLGRGKVGEQRFVPGLDQLPIDRLADFGRNPQELGPGLLAADVLVGLVDQRLQPCRGIAEMAAAIEQIDGRFQLPAGQQPLDLGIAVGQLAQRRDVFHRRLRQGEKPFRKVSQVVIAQLQQVVVQWRLAWGL